VRISKCVCMFNQLEKGKSWATLLPWGSTWQFSGRALPCEARRERRMKWRARDVAATPCHGPLQLLVMRHLRYPAAFDPSATASHYRTHRTASAMPFSPSP
jgi:hypothetical protein